MNYPLGYHITFGTYGARLPGSQKPHVDNQHNRYGEPLASADPLREHASAERMNADEVRLTPEQRAVVESAVRDLAARYRWFIRAFAARSNHVHSVVTAPREGEALRDAIKAVATRWLNKRFGTRQWWAEKGSAKYLYEPEYYANAIEYVKRQRET
jgi:REP element-mobilizing transposase RayT